MCELCESVIVRADLLERKASNAMRWRSLISYQERNQRRYQNELYEYFKNQLLRVRGRIQEVFVNVDNLINWQAEDDALLKIFIRHAPGAFGWGYRFAQDEVLGITVKESVRESRGLREDDGEDDDELDYPLNIMQTAALEALEAAFVKYAMTVNEHTKEQLRQIINTAVDEGWTVKHLLSEITDTIGADLLWRSERIARTELVRAINAGAKAAYVDSGFLKDPGFEFEAKRFNSAGEVVGTEMVEYPPAHPNCRCTIAIDPILGRLVWLVAWDELTCEMCWDLEAQSASA